MSTQFSTKKHWSYHYFTVLGVAVSALVALLVVFRLGTIDGRLVSTRRVPIQTKYEQTLTTRYTRLGRVASPTREITG